MFTFKNTRLTNSYLITFMLLIGFFAAGCGKTAVSTPTPQPSNNATMDEAVVMQVAALGPQGAEWAEGMALFTKNCIGCHGAQGEGTDIAPSLNADEVREKETAVLIQTISEGVQDTMMPAWGNILEPADIDALANFIQHWDEINASGTKMPQPEPIQVDADNPEDLLALGENLYNTTCIACHGENGSGGEGPVLNSQQILTRFNDEQIAYAIINGGHLPNSIMPAFAGQFTAVEIEALVSYVRAWEPTALWVDNPRGTAQGNGSYGDGQGLGQGMGNGYRGGANPDFQRGNGQGQGQGAGNGEGTATTNAANIQRGTVLQFTGEVLSISNNLLTFKNSTDNTTVEAMLGPPWFWGDNGILLNPGDQISLEGFESPNHLEINWLSNLTTGENIQLRTTEGIPVWAGNNGN